jgi:hypothetical protein
VNGTFYTGTNPSDENYQEIWVEADLTLPRGTGNVAVDLVTVTISAAGHKSTSTIPFETAVSTNYMLNWQYGYLPFTESLCYVIDISYAGSPPLVVSAMYNHLESLINPAPLFPDSSCSPP